MPARSAYAHRLGPLAGAALAVLAAMLGGSGHAAFFGALTAVSPSGASPAVTINITGTGFDPVAANNEVTFLPAAGPAVTARGTTIALLSAATGSRRLGVVVPAGLAAGRAALRVTNLTTNEVSEGVSIDIIGLRLPDVSSAARGAATIPVRIEGINTGFVAGTTRAAFGAGITVHSTTVHSATSLTASISIASTSAPGPRAVSVISPTQTATLASAFTVLDAGPPNRPPAASAGGPYSGQTGAAIGVIGSGSDPDGDAVTFTWDFGDGTTPVTGAPDQSHTYSAAGQYVATLTVRDGKGGVATASAQVSVEAAPPPNRDPVITSIANTSATEGEPYVYDVEGTDPDAGDALVYALAESPDGMTIVSGTGLISWTPPANPPGTARVTVTLTDPHGAVATQAFEILVTAATLGRGVITGWIFDDATGHPLGNASARLLGPTGAPTADLAVTSDALGRYRLSAPAGPARIRVTKEGYTAADLTATVVDTRRVEPDDARLTPLNPASAVVSSVAGGSVSHGASRLTIASGGLAQDRAVRVTDLGVQGARRRLPLGWRPLAVVDVDGGAPPFDAAARLSSRVPSMPSQDREVVLAAWSEAAGAWSSLGAASRAGDGNSLEGDIPGSGQYVFALADAVPEAPPPSPAGTTLTGVAPRAPPPATVTLDPAPRILFARDGARSVVTATATPAEPLSSGTPLRVELAESFTFANGATLRPVPGRRLIGLYGAHSAALDASLPVAPSRPLTPFSLREGAIDIAARLPADPWAPRGRVFGARGGEFEAAGGERVIVPPGAAAEDLPVDWTPIAPADFPLVLPAGHSLLRAFQIDLHGAPLARDLQVVLPGLAAPAGSVVLVAQLVDVGDATRMVLAAIARASADGLATTVDPLGDGSVRLPGLRSEGRYAVLAASGSYGYVTGQVTSAEGAPLAGALLDGATLPLGALSDALGRYVLLAPAGSVDIRVTNPANGDRTIVNAQVTGNAATDRPAPLGASPPVVVSVSPASAAAGVALGSSITVTFSEAIDPASVTPDAIRVNAGGVAVAGTLAFAPGNTAVAFRPSALLLSHTRYSLIVQPVVRDTAGHTLAAAFESHFTTVDVTPPVVPPAGTVVASIPGESGTSLVTGSQGTADPGGVVLVRNLRTNALTTLTPSEDGSFSGTIAALRSDRLELTIRDAAGNETTVPIAPFRGADGSVVVGAAGGRVEGPGGVAVDVPPGALPDGTVVRVTPVLASELALPPPVQYPFVGGVRLDLGGVTPREHLDLSIPAPADAAAGEQILVGRAISLPAGPAWTLVDRAQLDAGRYVTASPPFPSVNGGGVFAFFRPNGLSCISYVNLILQFAVPVFVQAIGDPFAFTSDLQSIVLANRCDQPLRIQVRDLTTGDILEEIDALTPPVNGAIASEPPATDDDVPPTIVQANTFNGSAVPYLQLVFSERMNGPSVVNNFKVSEVSGDEAAGVVELSESNTVATFRPDIPFKLGTQYRISVLGMMDTSFRSIDAEDILFTPMDPRTADPLVRLGGVASIGPMLTKCTSGACNTSVRDTASFGNLLFLANGLVNATDRYSFVPEQRLLAVDVKQPSEPLLIGSTGRPSNPRVLAAVRNASFTTERALQFNGDLLLVASGGRILDNVELPTRVEIYSVERCTRGPQGTNCLADVDTAVLGDGLPARRGERLLSTPAGEAPKPGVPIEAGEPQQMTVLHQRGREGAFEDVVSAYVVVSGMGLAAIDVTRSFNLFSEAEPNRGPNGVQRGEFLDVAAIRNRVFAIEMNSAAATMSLAAFSPQLTDKQTIALPGAAARLSALESFIVDVDGDGNLGTAEETDGDPLVAAQEIFDLAIVASGPLTSGCPAGVNPCGELYVLDVAGLTVPGHGAEPRVVSRIPVPGQPFSVQTDPVRQLAYVELRGRGLAIVDLSHVRAALLPDAPAPGLPGGPAAHDRRVLAIIEKTDIFAGEIKVDLERGIAFVNGRVSGLALLRVADCCTELSMDFQRGDVPDPVISRTGHTDEGAALKIEKDALYGILQSAAKALEDVGIAGVSMLEQGSGACLWRTDPGPGQPSEPDQLEDLCTAFDLRTSDHDIEVFVPPGSVRLAQDTLDAFIKAQEDNDESPIHDIGPLTLYAFSREAFESGELLIGTPLNKSGDGSGDLAMGRQTLLLLWLLEGAYVKPHSPTLPGFVGKPLDEILDLMKQVPAGSANTIVPGELSAIPRFEGYEWSRLQEFNLYKSGALLRLAKVCENGDRTILSDERLTEEANDADNHFEDNALFADDCVDQLRTVGKAGIRTVMARLIAHDATNQRLLTVDRENYRKTECLTGVGEIHLPPATPEGYTERPCGSFEEFIASLAIKSVRDGVGPFTAAQLPQIFTFYCAKVGHLCVNRDNQPGRILTTDAEMNAFIAATIEFIERAQVETRAAYDSFVANDNQKTIGGLPRLAEILQLCRQHGFTELSASSRRFELRACNLEIVHRKVNGHSSVVVGQPLPFDIVTDPDVRKALNKRYGVRGIVFRNLRVRAVNRGSNPVSGVLVKAYEGDGLATAAYTDLDVDFEVERLPGTRAQIIAEDSNGDPVYPAAFFVQSLTPNAARAISFFFDPDRRVPEADKRDNAAGFFYYRLNPAVPGGPQALPPQPALPITDVDADSLCIVPSGLHLSLLARHVTGIASPGAKEITMQSGQSVDLVYGVENRGSSPVTAVRGYRTGADQPVFEMPLLPGTAPGVEPLPQVHVEHFTPAQPGIYEIVARASGVDDRGNTVGAPPSRVRITVLGPACAPGLVPLDPNPNPTDKFGRPASSVELGGRFLRYYRLIDADGQPLPDVALRVQKRQLPGGEFVELPSVSTGPDGQIVHPPLEGTQNVPGLRLSATLLGDAGTSYEVRVFPGEEFGPCGIAFDAHVLPRRFSASLKGGASIEAEGAIEVNLAGRLGSGFELRLDRESTKSGGTVTVDDTNMTFNRNINAELGIGIKFATTKAGLTLGGELSVGKIDPSVDARAVLGLRDRHEFEPPFGLVEGAAIGQLLIGLVAVSAAEGAPTPAGPVLGLAINELFEHLGGLTQYRTAVGGSMGVKVHGGLDSSELNLKVTEFRKLSVKVEGTVDLSAIGSIDLLMPEESPWLFEPALELRAAFNGTGSIGLALADNLDALTPDEQANLKSTAQILADLFQANGSANLAGTVRFSAILDVGDVVRPRLRSITVSVTHQKKYGFRIAGQQIVDGGDAKVRRLTFRVTDRDPAKLKKAFETLTLIQALGEPSNVIFGPALAAFELVKVLSLADEYEERIEEGRAVRFPFGFELFLGGAGLESTAELRLDALSSHVTKRGTLRRSKTFRTEEYDEVDTHGLIPPSGFDALVQFLQDLPGKVRSFVRSYHTVTTPIMLGQSAAKTLIAWAFGSGAPEAAPDAAGPSVADDLAAQESAPGVELLVDGAAEPQDAPFAVELIAFQYRDRPGEPGSLPNDPAGVAGPVHRPHYGVGGFFHFAPSHRTLAAPAQLTIRYADAEIAGIAEQSLAIYRWNNVGQDWDRIGGTVDASLNTVTAEVTQLGLYTVAAAMPVGRISLTADFAAAGSQTAPVTVATFTSAPILSNTGAVVPDGTLFTVRPLVGNLGYEQPLGTILTPDASAALPGVQVSSQGGVIRFAAELPGALGAVVPLAFSVDGTAIADRVMPYQRPQ